MQKTSKLIILLGLLFSCASCYRFPTEDDYSAIPMTNNADYRHAKPDANPPGMPY